MLKQNKQKKMLQTN